MDSTEEIKDEHKTSLFKNAFWFLINNVLNIAFPFATGIYVARVLLPESIGIVTSAQNVVQYFVILAFLGIPTYGLREIAKARKDKDDLNKVYTELFIINLISTLFFSAIYLGLVFAVPEYRDNLPLYLITGALIILNALNNSWLFEGLEKFKFVSLRNVIFKAIMFAFLVAFVRKNDDYLIYAGITVFGTAGNYIVNFIFARKYVSFTWKGLNLKRHLKSIFFLVAVNFAIEIYTLVDVTMLDIFSTKENIAYYKYGSSICRIILQVINTFTMVLIPRISLLYKEQKYDEYNDLLSKALKTIVVIAVPTIIGIQFVSVFLICKIYGDIYIYSAYVLNIISAILLISPVGYLLGSRTLLVSGNEKLMIIPVSCGAVVNIIGNLILIPLYAEIGASIASVIGEVVVAAIYVFLGRKHFSLFGIWKDFLKVFIASSLMTGVLLLIYFLVSNEVLKCVLEITLASSLYFLILLLIKEDLVYELFDKIKNKFFKRKGSAIA